MLSLVVVRCLGYISEHTFLLLSVGKFPINRIPGSKDLTVFNSILATNFISRKITSVSFPPVL